MSNRYRRDFEDDFLLSRHAGGNLTRPEQYDEDRGRYERDDDDWSANRPRVSGGEDRSARRSNWRDLDYFDDYSGGPGRWDQPYGLGDSYRQRGEGHPREEWSEEERGPMAGLGPRGWQRSDERIGEDINDRLTHHGWIDATEVEVEVQDRVVTLRGTVGSKREKRLAEDIAEGVSGIHDIHNELKVSRRQ
jgi:hypothetical protein